MLKKVILIVLLAAVIGITAFYFVSKPDNNSLSDSFYGKFYDSHYTNEYIGLDVDLSDSWVYFNKDTLPKNAETNFLLGAELPESINNSFLVVMKPGIAVMLSTTAEQFGESDTSEEAMRNFGKLAAEAYGGNPDTISCATGSGKNGVSYVTLNIPMKDGTTSVMGTSFFNTEKSGIMAVGITMNGSSSIDDYLNLINSNITILHDTPAAA